MNVELLQKVKAHILEEPNRFVMGEWISKRHPGAVIRDESADNAHIVTPSCGTIGCIAGWTVLLAEGAECRTDDVCRRAAALLGISGTEQHLFYVDEWNLEDQERWEEAEAPEERVHIAADVIDDFIARHGRC